MRKDFSLEELEKLNELANNYEIIASFVKKYNKVNIIEFDYHIVHNLTLFSIDFDYDFDKLETIIERISKTMPAIKRIFLKPVIHLKENNEIQPIETVKRINNDSILHLSVHTELWDNINKNEIKPKKLLTKVYEDNYGIYENLVFCKAIDDILFYIRKNIRILKDLNYLNQKLEFDLLERVNHLSYFLALGKLHTGYIRNFDRYYTISNRCLKKLENIYDIITPRLKRPIYKKNKNRPKQLQLKKTNVLSMHKDYRQVYNLEKFFTTNNIKKNISFDSDKYHTLSSNYYNYCSILIIFALEHFNFMANEKDIIEYNKLNYHFEFKKWKINIQSKTNEETNYILISISKNITYTIILIPTVDEEGESEILEQMRNTLKADEYIVSTPYEHDIYAIDECYLDIGNVESFRRIQQFILRGMIKTDNERIDCPFCSNNLNKLEPNSYECENCRTLITDTICPETKEKYTYTSIAHLEKNIIDKSNYITDDYWIYYRKREATMYFRNITQLDENMDIICPCCNKVHK